MTLGSAPIGAAPLGAAPLTPLKIKTLTLCDFRAFAGPEPVTFNLDSKNLLVYGENGAGKSSIFHALDQFFSVADRGANERKQRLLGLKNIFSRKPDADVRVAVEFDDGSPSATWSTAGHPVDPLTATADTRVVNAAYRKAILDYRSLLETNYRHGNGAVNLFDVCITVLLRDFPVQHNGTERRVFDLWTELLLLLDLEARNRTRLTAPEKAQVLALLPSINSGLRDALALVLPRIRPMLVQLGWSDLEVISFNMPGITYHDKATIPPLQRIETKEIGITLNFRGEGVERPQSFLNEARLSALALAIYFAGRQVCAATLQANTPRLIVLDDVLIGLDQSNRMPVLRVLDQHFDSWQIVLLTHDRVWYEMARFHLADRVDWASVEMFEEKQSDGTPMPITGVVKPFVRPRAIDAIVDNIATARRFQGMSEYAAAAVHARVAFELSLKKVCERKSIPVRFKNDPRELSTEDLLGAIESWLSDTRRTAIKAAVDPAISRVRLARKVVLNQFSHSTPVSLADAEVRDAIDAVDALQKAFIDHIPTRDAVAAT